MTKITKETLVQDVKTLNQDIADGSLGAAMVDGEELLKDGLELDAELGIKPGSVEEKALVDEIMSEAGEGDDEA